MMVTEAQSKRFSLLIFIVNRFKKLLLIISNQFRKIEFWLLPPKQPFDVTVSTNDIKKSQELYVWRSLEKFENSKKTFNLIHKIGLNFQRFQKR